MADPTTTTTPDFTGVIDQRFFLAPIGGPRHPINYLDRFPEELYNKNIDSHLVKFLYSLLGPAGVGWIRKNYLETRLTLEDHGIELTDLDKFYGDPFKFSRILEEVYDQDPSGSLTPEQWESIRVKDSKYRSRALDFVHGARAGNTPLGMRLVARSGLGHEVEIYERYKYLIDQLTDDYLAMPNLGQTASTEEMVILPRRLLPQSEVQTIEITGLPTGGTFQLVFPMGDSAQNTTIGLNYNIDIVSLQLALEALQSIGKNDISVTGGPLPSAPVYIQFSGNLAYKDVPQIQATNVVLTGGIAPAISTSTERSGIDQVDEVVDLPPRDQHYLFSALEKTKPVTTIVTFDRARGNTSRQVWNYTKSSSEQSEVVRYVTGQSSIPWPEVGGSNWIQAGVERKALRGPSDLTHHYQGFHNVSAIRAYTELALSDPVYGTSTDVLANYNNEHIGSYTGYQAALYPILSNVIIDNLQQYADKAPADYAEPLTVQNITKESTPVALINGYYPVAYQQLQGVPEIKYKDDQFWSSLERETGDDYLEIDLGSPQAVNYVYFEATQKPYDIEVSYDLLDQQPSRAWKTAQVIPDQRSVTRLDYQISATNPWKQVELHVTNDNRSMIYTRFIRIKLARRNEDTSPFTNADGTLNQYSIEVKNLRIGRNVG